ncbi:MAG: hypothetical protein ABI972_19770 [Acidobacteriota bacterium]
MRIRGVLTGVLLVASVLPSGGCLFRKQKPTPLPTQIPRAKPAPPVKQDPMPPPPKVDAQAPALSTVPASPQEIDVPNAPPQQPRKPRRPAPAVAQPAAQDPAPSSPQPPAPEPPKLVQLLTADEQRRYQGELEQYLRNAEAIVAQASARTLDAQQSDMVIRIRAFTQQARDQRDTDLMTARNLAQRADVLAKDLQRSLR